jgi:hypothetical protein
MTPFVGSTYCREGLQDSSGAAPRGFPPQPPAHVCDLHPLGASYHVRFLFVQTLNC